MKNYLIVGHGGIGKALANQLQLANINVHVVSRTPQKNKSCTTANLTQPTDNTLTQLFQNTTFDCIINTTGTLYDDTHLPEKNITQLDAQWLNHSMQVNVLPTVHLAQMMTKHYQRNHHCKLISLSARVSSISDNRLGGWYSYRMTKCMLNMLIKNISIEWRRSHSNWLIAGYHPGTVDTRLSQPFQKNIPTEKIFTPDFAATCCINVINDLKADDSGFLFDWQGARIDA